MSMKTKLWVGLGAVALMGADLSVSPTHDLSLGLGSMAYAASPAGEGGEGGSEGGGGMPTSFKLNSTDANAFQYDAKAQVGGYAELVYDSYKASHEGAVKLQKAVTAFLAKPTTENLAAARIAWVNARIPYLQTEAFRFYDGPIDIDAKGEEGPEGHINAWPLNEAFIDYVKGAAKSGIVNNPKIKITADSILENDQVDDEADVTTGWHAIEFLLWGQDFSVTGPGNRPASDYAAGKGNNDRRRLYLKTVTDQLVGNLSGLADAWAPGKDNYAKTFQALDQREALGRVFAGLASLAGHELMSERLQVALDSGDQEDEHSCFSDTTRNDFIYDIRGMRNVWYGDSQGKDRPGLDALLAAQDPALALRIAGLINKSEAYAAALPQPFDSVLVSAKDSPERKNAEALAASLKDLADGFADAGAKLGVLVVIPTE